MMIFWLVSNACCPRHQQGVLGSHSMNLGTFLLTHFLAPLLNCPIFFEFLTFIGKEFQVSEPLKQKLF